MKKSKIPESINKENSYFVVHKKTKEVFDSFRIKRTATNMIPKIAKINGYEPDDLIVIPNNSQRGTQSKSLIEGPLIQMKGGNRENGYKRIYQTNRKIPKG